MEMEQNNENNETYNNVIKAGIQIRNLLFYASFFGLTALSIE